MSNDDTQDNKKPGFAGLSFANNKAFYISSCALFCLWLVFCWQGLTTVVEIWYGNEIFNHGFFIVPGAFYLIYLKRFELLSKPIQTSPLALIVIIPALLLYVIGVAGDIQLFLHAATFTLLPALIWLIIGTQAAKTILFPLIFMLFSIPVGEQLIPYLQEIAADGSVALLRLTGVPLFRSGLYIEIPQGRFLVAEACSGVSFFIASFVIGSLYAYLNLVSVKRRAAFVTISLIFPILANIVRVYGIILIAYWTDMEHAAGADHLIYGWLFFAFVIVCLLGIGELLRDASVNKRSNDTKRLFEVTTKKFSIAIVLVLFGCFYAWIEQLEPDIEKGDVRLLSSRLSSTKCSLPSFDLKPKFENPYVFVESSIEFKKQCVTFYEASFSGPESEMVNSLNRPFNEQYWSIVGTEVYETISGTTSHDFYIYRLSSPSGEIVYYTFWYEYFDRRFKSPISAKLYEISRRLTGNLGSESMVVVTSSDVSGIEALLVKLKLINKS